jgi:PhnB protein
MHAGLRIGDSRLFLVDEMPGMSSQAPLAPGAAGVGLHLYVEDADAVFNRAVAAGAKVAMPLADMFWGDRFGKLIDPFKYEWTVATHKEDLTPAEMKKRQEAAFAQMGKKL